MRLSGAYGQGDLDALCAEIEAIRGGGRPPTIDLGELSGLEPAALAVLMATFGSLDAGALNRFTPPANVDGLAVLQPQPLRQLLAARHGRWHRHEDGDPLTGIEVFRNLDGVYRTLKAIAAALREIDSLPPVWMRSMHALAFELTNNVLRHSDAPCGAVVIEIDESRDRVLFAIADGGVGIRAGLARNPELAVTDDLAAIRTAISAQTTGEPGRGAGMGLFMADRVLDDHRGSLLIRSGTGFWELTPQAESAGELGFLPGTLVVATLDTGRPLDYGQIEEELEDPRGLISRSDG
ncbi:MAG: sensor histidine kinase [Actinobacteria bacterium]|nr:sensor histidine kinase [Actinomycetota bacterium]